MIKNTNWNVKNIKKDNESFETALLNTREISKDELCLSVEMMHDPLLINDIDIASYEIIKARRERKKTLVFGDYDVDGTMATYELTDFLRSIGMNCDYYIPDRLKEGYGMSNTGIDYIIDNNYELVITVDTGITAIDQINRLNDAGITTIVTDHHECKKDLPKAAAVIDCKRPDSNYPFSEICGATVALKLIQVLCLELSLPDSRWQKYIEYATLATVADVMPLIDENRILVTAGLEMIKNTNSLAILNLLRVSEKLQNVEVLSSYDIGFYLAPLINAASRVGTVKVVMDLLFTNSEEDAVNLSEQLKAFNQKRKEIEAQILNEAIKKLINEYDFKSPSPIVVYGDNWHRGVIGIVASRLVTLFNKPVIILTNDDGHAYHGSCRTFKDINMIKILDYAADTILKYGGHEGAAGLTVELNQIEKFSKKIAEYGYRNFTEEMLFPVSNVDMQITTKDITLENAKFLRRLAPYGQGNEEPIFCTRKMKVNTIKKIGQKAGSINAHLKITLSPLDNKLLTIDGIGFYMSDYVDIIKPGDIVDVSYLMAINVWNNKETVQIMIKDIHFDMEYEYGLGLEENKLFKEDFIAIPDIAEEYGQEVSNYIPSTEDYFFTCKYIGTLFTNNMDETIITDLDLLSLIVEQNIKRPMNPFKLARILEVNSEAGYFHYKELLFDKILIKLTENKTYKRLSETAIYKELQSML